MSIQMQIEYDSKYSFYIGDTGIMILSCKQNSYKNIYTHKLHGATIFSSIFKLYNFYTL